MYKRNGWDLNEKFSLYNIAQDVLSTPQNNINSSCCVDTTKISGQQNTSCCIDTTKMSGPCGSDINTSCCIDTTKMSGPCGSDINTSCCIDTTKE